jgi:phosphodiesterase/alkaline phosphatase D-like protein
MDPDFMIHLGDLGYPDTGAYAPSKQGYFAFWTDLLYEAQLSRLFRRPWIYLASDHDLGGNNIDATSYSPHASEAFTGWANNDPTADGSGRYGSVELDDGRVLVVWLEGVLFRSPIVDPDGPDKVMLGSEQKRWLLDLLGGSNASLIIIASQTTIGHASDTGWPKYETERREVLDACGKAKGTVRWISGDHHSARYAKLGTNVAEWGAAPFAEITQGTPAAAPFAEDAVCVSGSTFATRDEALSAFSEAQIASRTSFGRIVIDTIARTATFEVRDNVGEIRVAETGFRMAETIAYG